MLSKKTVACAAVVVTVMCGSYALRGFVWGHSHSGEPDASGLLVSPDSQFVTFVDGDVPLSSGPGELTQVTELPEVRLLRLLNAERAEAYLEELIESEDLSAAAALRAEELAMAFSHTRPDGESYRSLLDEEGIRYHFSGENIAGGYPTADDALEAWMDSDGFRKNILNPDFTHVGTGYFDTDQGMRYWCVLFVY